MSTQDVDVVTLAKFRSWNQRSTLYGDSHAELITLFQSSGWRLFPPQKRMVAVYWVKSTSSAPAELGVERLTLFAGVSGSMTLAAEAG